MNIGTLDRKIVIQNFTTAKNDFGEDEKTWAAYHTTFARIRQPATGSEKSESDRRTATNKKKFLIRYYTGITQDMRIVYGGQNYDILDIHEWGREGLELTAEVKY